MHERIALIEDEADLANLASAALTKEGFKVAPCGSISPISFFST
jgi:DNA-binding response OmpR family regulator